MMTAAVESGARWASCRCAGRPARACTGTTASGRARHFSANGRAPATNISRTRTATTSIAAGATTCSRSAASMSRRSRSRARSAPIPRCSKRRSSRGRTRTSLIKPKAFVVLKSADKACDELARALQGPRQRSARALQVSALDRVLARAAEDRDRQDPALQAARGARARLTGSST